ncbi:MAG: hypothetical protein REH83_04265 [Rickettsiella sp.]|nr:hypothetical protein [Rickettsiella sp.]
MKVKKLVALAILASYFIITAPGYAFGDCWLEHGRYVCPDPDHPGPFCRTVVPGGKSWDSYKECYINGKWIRQ